MSIVLDLSAITNYHKELYDTNRQIPQSAAKRNDPIYDVIIETNRDSTITILIKGSVLKGLCEASNFPNSFGILLKDGPMAIESIKKDCKSIQVVPSKPFGDVIWKSSQVAAQPSQEVAIIATEMPCVASEIAKPAEVATIAKIAQKGSVNKITNMPKVTKAPKKK